MGKGEHSLSPNIWSWSLTTSNIEVSFFPSLKYKMLNDRVAWRIDFALQQWTSSAIAIANTISVYEPVLPKCWREGRGRDPDHGEVYSLQHYMIKWLAAGRWFTPGNAVTSTNKTDRHDIADILLTVALNTITITHKCCTYKEFTVGDIPFQFKGGVLTSNEDTRDDMDI